MWHWNLAPSKLWLVIRLASLILLVVACGTAAPATPVVEKEEEVPRDVAMVATPTLAPATAAKVHPGKLTIMVGDLGNERFTRLFGSSTQGQNFGRIMGGYLIATNHNTELIPGIASQWDVSADGLTWTFTVRKGVKFHDGSALTPEDVLWNLQHLYGPQVPEYATPGQQTRWSRDTDRVELTGPDEVSMTLKHPINIISNVLSEVAADWFPMMPKRATFHDSEEARAYDNNPIGAGPMRLVEHIPASVMKFERFDDFYYQLENGLPEDRRVNFQSLDLFLVPEEATRVAAVRAGEADIVPASLSTRKQVEAGGGRLVFGPEGMTVEARPIGCMHPEYPCYDKRVRQALDLTIEKELIQQLYGGPEVFQIKGWGPVTPNTVGYTPELDPWPFDPDTARQLLADAGYPGGQGFGKLIVNTHPSTAVPFQVESAQMVADSWRRELGLDVEVRVTDSVGLRDMMQAFEINGQIMWRDDDTRKETQANIENRYGDPEGGNRLHEDPELFRLTQETYRIVDPDKRAEATTKLLLRLREEAYVFNVGYANIPWAVGPRVLTWQPYPLATHVSALYTVTLK
jgi:peptide/nickel transport system substrate-binding protein